MNREVQEPNSDFTSNSGIHGQKPYSTYTDLYKHNWTVSRNEKANARLLSAFLSVNKNRRPEKK